MPNRRAVYGVFVLAGIANATIKPAAATITGNGWLHAMLNGFDINAIVWMALAIGIWRLWDEGTQACGVTECGAVMVASLGFLMPLASVSWMVLGTTCLCAAVLSSSSPSFRGLTIIGLAAVRDPVAKGLLDVFAEPLLTLDAYVSSLLLILLGKSVEREGNIMAASSDHALLVMSGCSSFTNLSLALLAWASIMVGFSRPTWKLLWIGGTILGTAVVLLNSARLSLMALSIDTYRIVHDEWGADVFLLVSTMLIVSSIYVGLRHAR